MREGISLSLDADQALVLFELLSRWEETGLDRKSEHPAEDAVLSQVLAVLERELAAPFQPDYRELLSAAREKLTPSGG